MPSPEDVKRAKVREIVARRWDACRAYAARQPHVKFGHDFGVFCIDQFGELVHHLMTAAERQVDAIQKERDDWARQCAVAVGEKVAAEAEVGRQRVLLKKVRDFLVRTVNSDGGLAVAIDAALAGREVPDGR